MNCSQYIKLRHQMLTCFIINIIILKRNIIKYIKFPKKNDGWVQCTYSFLLTYVYFEIYSHTHTHTHACVWVCIRFTKMEQQLVCVKQLRNNWRVLYILKPFTGYELLRRYSIVAVKNDYGYNFASYCMFELWSEF